MVSPARTSVVAQTRRAEAQHSMNVGMCHRVAGTDADGATGLGAVAEEATVR